MDKPNIIIIPISGRARVGKDTAAEYYNTYIKLNRNITCRSTVCSFADAVKQYAAEKYNLDLDRLYTDIKYKEENRHYLLKVGADGRSEDLYKWVKIVIKNFINNFIPKQDKVKTYILFIPDNRYFNEIYYCIHYLQNLYQDFNFHVFPIHIFVSDEIMRGRLGNDTKFANWINLGRDQSEREMRPDTYNFHAIISNNNEIDEYYEILRTYLINILHKVSS